MDQGCPGEKPTAEAAAHGIELEIVKLAEAKRGFVRLPRRWVVERSFAWLARFRRLSRDYEWLPTTLAGLHWLAFVCLASKQPAFLHRSACGCAAVHGGRSLGKSRHGQPAFTIQRTASNNFRKG